MRWAESSLKCFTREADKVIRLLRIAIEYNESHHDFVNVAGSSPLHWFQLKHGLCVGNSWKPNDVDIFCCNEIGASGSSFLAYVGEALARIKAAGYEVKDVSRWSNKYVSEDSPVLTVRVKVQGIETAFSFIQQPLCRTVSDAVSQFDIDVCKVICKVHSGTERTRPVLEADSAVNAAIRSQSASCKTFQFKEHVPSDFEVHLYEKTLLRMRKYADRGFTFTSYPKIVSENTE